MIRWGLLILLAMAFVAAADSAPDAPRITPIDSVVVFEHAVEARERAFHFLKPAGWITVGGIERADPLALGPRDDVVAPQLDLTIERDSLGTALIHWLPNVVYCDARHSPAAGLFPEGSTYQGMLVYPLMSAQDYLLEMMAKRAHPAAGNFEFVEQRRLPELADQYQRRVHALRVRESYRYDAAMLTVQFDEGGVTYRERWLAVIEDQGELGAGQWGNKETLVFRAPVTEFARLEPVFGVVQGSLAVDPVWISQEVQTEVERGDIPLATRGEQAQIDSQIAAHRRLTNAAIHTSVFVADDHPGYLNPFTGVQETGSGYWPYRWVNAAGTVIYCTDSDYDPNLDSRYSGNHFRKCEGIIQTNMGTISNSK